MGQSVQIVPAQAETSLLVRQRYIELNGKERGQAHFILTETNEPGPLIPEHRQILCVVAEPFLDPDWKLHAD